MFASLIAGADARPADAAEYFFNSYGWSNVYRYDTTSGAVTHLPASNILAAGFASAAAFGPDGAMYGGSAFEVYRITYTATNSVWSKNRDLVDIGSDGIAFDDLGRMYTANSDAIHRVNAAGQTEWSLQVHNGSSQVFLRGLGFANNGQMWAAGYDGLYRINTTSGAATLVYPVPGAQYGSFTGMSISDDDVIVALSYYDYLYTYDTVAGVGSWSAAPLTYNGSSFAPSSIAARGLVNPALPDADFNGDDRVDGRDFLTWQRGKGATTPTFAMGDADRDGAVDGDDLAVWRTQFGATPAITAVPEPSAAILAVACVGAAAWYRRRRCKRRAVEGA